MADREFEGRKWIGRLYSMGTRYYIRIRQNFWIDNPRTGKRIRASHLFSQVRLGEELFYHKLYLMKGEYVCLVGARLKNSDGKPELQILVHFNKPEDAVKDIQGQMAGRDAVQDHEILGVRHQSHAYATPRQNRETCSRGMRRARMGIARQLGTTVYFADPYASWQKGAIENANKLIRQYIPKGTSFKTVTDQKLAYIQAKINARPRQKLNFSTPKEEFFKHFL